LIGIKTLRPENLHTLQAIFLLMTFGCKIRPKIMLPFRSYRCCDEFRGGCGFFLFRRGSHRRGREEAMGLPHYTCQASPCILTVAAM